MFHKKLLAVVFGVAIAVTAPSMALAGGAITKSATITATTPTTINVGESVTFAVTYLCAGAWSSATGQLFNGSTMTNENKLGTSIQFTQVLSNSISRPRGFSGVTETKTITFNNPGTYSVNVDIRDVTVQNLNPSECAVVSTSAASVTVIAPATTTVAATTTTVAATTTTTASALPKTGTDSNNALIALAVMTAGVAIIAGRRRLLTK